MTVAVRRPRLLFGEKPGVVRAPTISTGSRRVGPGEKTAAAAGWGLSVSLRATRRAGAGRLAGHGKAAVDGAHGAAAVSRDGLFLLSVGDGSVCPCR